MKKGIKTKGEKKKLLAVGFDLVRVNLYILFCSSGWIYIFVEYKIDIRTDFFFYHEWSQPFLAETRVFFLQFIGKRVIFYKYPLSDLKKVSAVSGCVISA